MKSKLENAVVILDRFVHTQSVGIAALALIAVAIISSATSVYAATLTSASLSLTDPRPSSASVMYDLLASGITSSTIRCVREVYSVNADGTGGAPAGFNSSVSAAVSAGSSTLFSSHTGWSLDKSTNGTLLYTNSTGASPSLTTSARFVVTGITNGSTANTPYYMTFSTYSNTDCSTGLIDSVVVQYVYINGQQVTVGVDPSLSFVIAGVAGDGAKSVNGSTITNGLTTTASTMPFGTLSAAANKVAAQDLTVSTNSSLGYGVAIRYTGKPTSNTNTIDDLSATNASPQLFSAAGTEGFGYTTEDASLGTGIANRFDGGKWASFTTSNAEVVYNNAPVANQTTRVGVQTGISGATEPGAYTTTIIYTATPVY